MSTLVVQTNAAVWTKIDAGVFQIHRPFAPWANSLGQARQRSVVFKHFASLGFRLRLGQALLFEIAVQGQNGLSANQHRDGNTHQVSNVSTVTGQVRHKFDEKNKQGKVNKAKTNGQ